MVELQSERRVKKLITDNGLEFCNFRFDSFCKQEGIVRHKTCTYTPQQNGVAERLNRSIMNKVRIIEFEITEERWTSAAPNLSNLRVFGCVAYVHSDEGKLNPRAKKGIFTGYPEGVKGFRVWLLDEKKVTISRNVVFREDVMYKDIKDSSSTSGMQFIPVLSDELASDLAGNNRESGTTVQGGAPQDQNEREPDTEQVTESEEATGNSDQNLSNYQLAKDRTRRDTKKPARLQDYQVDDEEDEDIAGYAYVVIEDGGRPEPGNFQEALRDRDSDKWMNAADDEMDSLRKNETWKLVDRVKTQRAIGCRWIFTRKAGIVGVENPRFKARLVAKGYSQKEGIDYQEIFSPVVKHVSIRFLLSAVVHFNMELQQMDVKTAFLHGFLDETIYMEQPEGYVDERYPEKVCLLQRSLYGLKQSPRQWNTRFDNFMQSHGYIRSEYDSCIYFKELKKNEYVYLLLYVDDILIASVDKTYVKELKELLSSEFEMKDLGEAKKILGMEITRDRVKGTLTISQEGYVSKVLGNFGMDQSKPVSTPMGAHLRFQAATEEEFQDQFREMEKVPYQSAVGSLMYSMIGTRPDLAYAVGLVCRFMSKPIKEHWLGVKWILRLRNRSRQEEIDFKFSVHAWWKYDQLEIKSTEDSSVMNNRVRDTVDIYSDSQSAIALAKNAVHHERTKHVDIKFHFLRDLINEGKIRVLKIATEYNPADIFTKVIPVGKFQEALELLRIRDE
ncbi:unnamed protein product [Microthlaspi erraticum]|uniref:Integrase catalytic domain-containing protein n=1 Tax=Microthlaspi erraticum TaxID=1685480 RepID=A0A6D2JSZ4_9BRAS|nr:unnamed protein product [Microthlaspi erraticum]